MLVHVQTSTEKECKMPQLSRRHLRSHLAEAHGAMAHQRQFKDPTPTGAQLLMGEALWVALLRMGYPSMNALKRREGFQLQIISYRPEPAEGYAGLRAIEISYYHPSDQPGVIGDRMDAILRDLRGLLVPILGEARLAEYMYTQNQPWLTPARLDNITIASLPEDAIVLLRDAAMK